MSLVRFKCYKEVEAVKIAAIEFADDGSAKIAATIDYNNAIFQTDTNYKVKFHGNEDDLGYYVVYKDGYQSWSPTKAFEEGYIRI